MQNPTTLHSYIKLNNSFVHTVQYSGPNVENIVRPRASSSPNQSLNGTSPSSPSKRNIIVFIPGNPGLLGVYHDYLCSLYKTICHPSNRRAHGQPIILAISHNNFDHPDCCQQLAAQARKINIDESEMNFVEKSMVKSYINEPHNIELQVINKLIILKRLVLSPVEDDNQNKQQNIDKVIFVGHSIGCYVILKLLQDKQLSQHHHAGTIMIHPALENLALTEKGSITATYFNFKMDLLLRGIALVLDTFLPKSVKINLTKWATSREFAESSSEIVLESMSTMASASSLNALIEMAKSEFSQVKNINNGQMIEPHLDKLHLIYANTDHWVNKEHREQLKRLYEDRISIEVEPTLHAFIMDPETVSSYAVKVGMLIEDLLEEEKL